MSTVHVWSCGRCGALVRATAGTISSRPSPRMPRDARPAPFASAAGGGPAQAPTTPHSQHQEATPCSLPRPSINSTR